MNQEIKARWVAALRNSDARQAYGLLGKTDGSRCCLGVLCDIAVEDGVIGPPFAHTDGYLIYDGASSMPPAKVRAWAGWDDNTVEHVPPLLEEQREVIFPQFANDDLQLTFPQIADLIERNL